MYGVRAGCVLGGTGGGVHGGRAGCVLGGTGGGVYGMSVVCAWCTSLYGHLRAGGVLCVLCAACWP